MKQPRRASRMRTEAQTECVRLAAPAVDSSTPPGVSRHMLIADDTNSITAVEYDDAMTKFRVSVDAARYTQFESFYVLAFYMQGALYQQFSGVAPDDVDIAVEFVDQATGEVLDTGSYQEMRENFPQ